MKHLFKVDNTENITFPYANMVNPSICIDKNHNIKILDKKENFCIKLLGKSQPSSNPLFSCKSYVSDDNLFVACSFNGDKRGMFKFNIDSLETPTKIFKKVLNSEDDLYNYSLQGAIGVDNNNNHLILNLPNISEKTPDTMTANYQCGIIQSNYNNNSAWKTYTINTHVEVKGIHNERLCPTSNLYVYDGYTYFVAYDYGIEGVANNRVLRIAYICRTQDMVTFETKPLLDVTANGGAITSMSDKKLQVSEPDIVITKNGKAYFVIRLVGNYTVDNSEEHHRNDGYFYGEIENVNDYFSDIQNYPQWDFEDINEFYGSTVTIKKIICNEINAFGGGHLKGVLPRIFLNPTTSTPMVVLYARCNNRYAHNQLYILPDPTNSLLYYKIGKSHNWHGNSNSPEGGNMSVQVFKNYLSIICPHNRTNEVCCFFIPLQNLYEITDSYDNNSFYATLEHIEDNSVEVTF